MELISISRTFTQAQDQEHGFDTYDDLRSVLQVVDDALRSATDARKKTLKNVDETFQKAIEVLSGYEERHHPNARISVIERMEAAENSDKSSMKFLNKLKENWHPLVEEQTMTVEFILHKTLLDRTPTIVPQVLCQSSDVKEVLWNFSQFSASKDPKKKKLLTLKQHPHFYKGLPEKYDGGFQTSPTETFYHKQINVLTDNLHEAGRVYLELPTKGKRVYSNVWDAKDTIVFKDIFGSLEGENVVGLAIKDTPNVWCFEELPRSPSHISQQTLSTTSTVLNSSLSTAVPPTPATSPRGELFKDWKEPIRRMTRFLDTNIRIAPILPTGASHNYPPPQGLAPPFQTPSFDPNPIVFIPPIDTPQPRPHIKVQIPETPSRSSTPLSNKTTRCKPLSRQPSVTELSSIMQTPSSHTASIRLPSPGPPESPPDPTEILCVSPVITREIITSPSHDESTHSETFEAEDTVGDDRSQHTDSDLEDEDSSDDVASSVTLGSTSRPRTAGGNAKKKKKRKWYKKMMDRLMGRKSPQ